MQGNLTLSTFGLIWISITLGSFGQIFLKKGLGHTSLAADSLVATLSNLFHAIIQPWVMAGLALYVLSTFFWMTILSRVRLSVAYPLISMSYPVVVVLSAVVLKEPVHWSFAATGLVFISLGVTMIGYGLGRNKEANS